MRSPQFSRVQKTKALGKCLLRRPRIARNTTEEFREHVIIIIIIIIIIIFIIIFTISLFFVSS